MRNDLRLPDPAPVYDAENERAFRDVLRKFMEDTSRMIYPSPLVTTAVARDGADRDITHTIVDPLRQFLELEYQVDGGGWLTGANWTATVVGSQYDKTVTLTPGKDSIYEIRMSYKDQDGQRKYKYETVPLADLQLVTKKLIVGFAKMKPIGPSGTANEASGSGYLTINTDDSALWSFVAGIDEIPIGAIITGYRVLAREGSSGNDGPTTYLRRADTADPVGITTFGTINHSGETSVVWKTDNASLPHTVSDSFRYYLLTQMVWTTAEANAPRWYEAEITYTVADYAKTR